MRGKWSKGGFIKKNTNKPTSFLVVGISDSNALLDFGRFTNFEEAKEIAKINATKDLTCYVYSDDNKVKYSTES